jgi:hypothetical protein
MGAINTSPQSNRKEAGREPAQADFAQDPANARGARRAHDGARGFLASARVPRT